MGAENIWTVEFSGPSIRSSFPSKFYTLAGDEIVVGINGNGVVQEILEERYRTKNTSTARENLNLVSLYYWVLSDKTANVIGNLTDTLVQRIPSVGKLF